MVNVTKERVVTKSYRIQTQILNFESIKVLWLNTYLPTDPLTIGQYDNTELLSVLEEVDSIFADNIFNEVIWGSDLNWDMARNSHFSKTMNDYVQKLGLVSLWSSHPVPYTHVHTDGKSKSTIDHFVLSSCLISLVEDFGIVERGDNVKCQN